jgi:hypothetical protein
MASKYLYLNVPSLLQLDGSDLLIEERQLPYGRQRVPLKSLGMLFVHHQEVAVPFGVMDALEEHRVLVLRLDGRMRCFDPYYHEMQLSRARELQMQLKLSLSLRLHLWRQVLQEMLHNQYAVLHVMELLTPEIQNYYEERMRQTDFGNYHRSLEQYERLVDLSPIRSVPEPKALLQLGRTLLKMMICAYLNKSGVDSSLGWFGDADAERTLSLTDTLALGLMPLMDFLILQSFQVSDYISLRPESYPTVLMEVLPTEITTQSGTFPLKELVARQVEGLLDCYLGIEKTLPPTLFCAY